VSARSPERREGAVDLASNEIGVRAGFRVSTDERLAGAPLELEFFVESLGLTPLHLAAGVDRARQRPDRIDLAATFEGSPLDDPWEAMPTTGGPLRFGEVSTRQPLRLPLLLNDFVRLEQTPERLAEGLVGRLVIACRRVLPLAANEAEALETNGAPAIAVDLAVDLRRDDAALSALALRLFEDVMNGSPALRERPLAQLLSMRASARAQIVSLATHPDLMIADRARRVVEIQRL
jgi:hypothetical protein